MDLVLKQPLGVYRPVAEVTAHISSSNVQFVLVYDLKCNLKFDNNAYKYPKWENLNLTKYVRRNRIFASETAPC